MMNHGFFNTTHKVWANPCPGRAPFHQGKESTAMQIQIERNDDLFYDIRGLVHVDWVTEVQTYYKEFFTNLRERARRKT
jgi:alpha-galactosidase/6-phospho-beta-glucosidase family protein